MTSNHDNLAADLLKGAVAGVIATWMMDRVTTFFYERQDEQAHEFLAPLLSGGWTCVS